MKLTVTKSRLSIFDSLRGKIDLVACDKIEWKIIIAHKPNLSAFILQLNPT